MFRSGLAVVSGIVLNNIAGSISDSVLAGIGISNKIMMFPFGIILGFGAGFQPVAGFNWGAKRYDRVLESYRFSSRMALVGAAIMGVILGVFAHPVIHLFSETDPAVQSIGAVSYTHLAAGNGREQDFAERKIRLKSCLLYTSGWV